MKYTIKSVAERFALTPYTLRYYEKEGLLPFVKRDEHGNRAFAENDIEWLTLICCLRDTGMTISEIRRYVELCMEGTDKILDRRQIILEHKKAVEEKIAQMQKYLAKINAKLQYYDDLAQQKGLDCCNPYKK